MKLSVNKYFVILFSFIFLVCVDASAQKSKKQLEKEKKENLKKIQEASKVLEQTKVEENATIGQLNAINEKVRAQQSLIGTIKKEIKYMARDIDDNQLLITSLKLDLSKMKTEYEQMVYEASKTDNNYNKLLFIFSSQTLYDIYLKYKFLEQYADARRKQAEQIMKVNEELINQNIVLKSKRIAKENLVGIAAIAPKIAAEIFGLAIIEDEIQTIQENSTRFVIVQTEEPESTIEVNKASLKFQLNHKRGSLAAILNVLSDCKMNLTKIQSLPVIETPWKYSFFVDVTFEEYKEYEKAKAIIEIMAEEFKILGTYKNGRK